MAEPSAEPITPDMAEAFAYAVLVFGRLRAGTSDRDRVTILFDR